VEAGPLDELGRARIDLLRAEVAYSQDRGSDAPPLLLRAAKTLEPLDPRLARETYLDALGAAVFAGGMSSAAGLIDVSRAAMAGPRAPDPPRPSDLLLDGFALLFTEGRTAAAPVLERAATAFAGSEASTEEALRWGWLATMAAAVMWDYETCVAVATRAVQLARDSGALTVLAVGVNILGQVVALGGDFAKAASLVAEAEAVTEATGARVMPYAALVLAALRGQETEATSLIETTIGEATAGGQGTAVQEARWATAVIANGAGRYEDAQEAAKLASDDTPELVVSAWALSELVEAATRSGKAQLAAAALARLAARTENSDGGWGLGLVARSRALLSEGEGAERQYCEAIDRLAAAGLRPDLARSHLLYGEWLRRENRRVDARAQLRAAHEMLATMGADGFAERARRELVATGEKVRKRRDDTRDELTPQEEQIARLASDGRTNSEIGAQLFISPRTVEWHLRKVFAKLGVSSRRGLHNALPTRDQEATPA